MLDGPRPYQPGDAQHRDLTVMFVDLVGSTELAAQLDLESYHQVMNLFLGRCAHCVQARGGYVARFMGDGLLAYFGYPRAHEDDAVRAITAALDIQDWCEHPGPDIAVPLETRCGIASGSAIIGAAIGSGEGREVPVFGDIANLAARLQSAARHGSVLVSPETRKRTVRHFAFSPAPGLRLKGFPAIQCGWEAERRKKLRHWSGESASQSRSSLIGRHGERAIFESSWLDACSGRGSTIWVSGDAGIGKSHLIHDWIRRVVRREVQCHLTEPDPLNVQTPFHLVTQLLNAIGSGPLNAAGPADDNADAAAMAEHVLAQFDDAPTLLVMEDLHWADPSSRDVIDGIARQLAHRPILMVTTSRMPPPQTFQHSGVRQISLAPLTVAHTHELVARVVGQGLPAQQLDEVVTRSGGFPFFAEELARLMLDAPVQVGSQRIPSTLAGLLLARLTMLGPAMALAQCAAILGVEIPVAALEGLAERRGINIIQGFEALDRENVACVVGEPAVLRFRHALYRDALLETLLSTDRKSLYRDAAELLEASATKIVPDSVLADFWFGAGEPGPALDALHRAVDNARRQRAWREVKQLVETALRMLRAIPPGQRGAKRALGLQTLLTEALQITVGYSSPAARAAATEAQRMAERIGEIDQSMMSVAGKWMAASSAGDYREARVVAVQALSLAQLHGGDEALAAAHMIDMTTRYRVGDLFGAELAFRSGGEFFAAPAFVNRAGAIPQTFGNAALVAVLTGDSAAARQRANFALRAGRLQNSAYDRCFAAYMVAMVEILLGADRKAAALGASALRLAEAIGFPQFAAIARIVIGRARAGMGDVDAGIALLREGLAAMAGTYSRNAQTLYLTWLAEAALSGGDIETALETSDAALAVNADEIFYRPETLRIRSLALLRRGFVPEAAVLLREGEALAISMQAPWFTERMQPLKARLGLG